MTLTLIQIVLLALGIAVALGVTGTLIEAVGKRRKNRLLTGIGQRLEGAFFDVPKFLCGESISLEALVDQIESERLPKIRAREPPEEPPTDPGASA